MNEVRSPADIAKAARAASRVVAHAGGLANGLRNGGVTQQCGQAQLIISG